MKRNSSRLNCWGETFFTMAIVKFFKENWLWCTSLACIASADFSHLSSVKHPRCPLVRWWHSWVVRPKYASFSAHNLHNQNFRDLQSRFYWILILFIVKLVLVVDSGHWRHPPLLHLWFALNIWGKLTCLFLTTVLPIELRFFVVHVSDQRLYFLVHAL